MMMTTFAWPPDDDDDDEIHARCKQRQPEEHAYKTLIDLYVWEPLRRKRLRWEVPSVPHVYYNKVLSQARVYVHVCSKRAWRNEM